MSAQPGRVHLFGVPVDVVDASDALERAKTLYRTAASGVPALVFTPNPELIMRCRTEPDLLAVARAPDLALADGIGVVWALRRNGAAVAARVPGVEFMADLLDWAAAEGHPVFFLGARAEVVTVAAANAVRRYPGLVIAGMHDGYFAPGDAPEVARQVAASGARLLFVGMGAPAQERFLVAQRARLGEVRLAMGVGGSLDVLAGVAQRAPHAVRRLGLEWLWRLMREPSRWRRQLALPRFAWAVLRAPRR